MMNQDFESKTIREANFREQLRSVVLPYLAARKSDLQLHSASYDRARCSVPAKNRKEEAASLEILHIRRYLADDPRGVVMICHGFSESAPKYSEVVYHFLKMGFHVYLPEHCGHGLSYRLTDDPSLIHLDYWTRYADDFRKVSRLAHRKHPALPLYLYAHSMGGAIAAMAASKEPALYQKVILSSPMIRPLTGPVPWPIAILIAEGERFAGRGAAYVIGQQPYSGQETFEDSACNSRPRFETYRELRQKTRNLQTCAASYGWLFCSAQMSNYLLTRAWKRIAAPVLLLQAEKDSLVSLRAQNTFVLLMKRYGKAPCRIVRFPGTKHELFNGGDAIQERYWKEIERFLV